MHINITYILKLHNLKKKQTWKLAFFEVARNLKLSLLVSDPSCE